MHVASSQRAQVRELTAEKLDTAARYSYRVWWSDEDQIFLVEAAELEGTTIDDASLEAALRNAVEAAAMWLTAAAANGEAPPRPTGHQRWKTRMTTTAAPPDGSTDVS